MRTFTFRFIHARWRTVREITIDSADEPQAKAAAWALLVAQHCGRDPHGLLPDWRLVAIRIEPFDPCPCEIYTTPA